jgi:AcrR family transcriptional regulator
MKEALKAYKRRRILEAAMQLFYERGFSGTTMDAVAESLSVTKQFIYAYFENKNALLAAIYEEVTGQLLENINGALSSDAPPATALAEFVRIFARVNMESQVVTAVFLQEEKHLDTQAMARIRKLQKTFDERFADLLRRGTESGVFDVRDPGLAALAITGMLRWIQRGYRENGRLEVEAIAELMAELALKLVSCKDPDAYLDLGALPPPLVRLASAPRAKARPPASKARASRGTAKAK